jgi:hypothetical protein
MTEDDKALKLPCRASTQMIFRGGQARYILTWLSQAQDEVQIGTACLDSHRLAAGAVKQMANCNIECSGWLILSWLPTILYVFS